MDMDNILPYTEHYNESMSQLKEEEEKQ